MLYREPLVQAALQGDFLRGQTPDLSLRSVQRRFVHSTGLSHNAIYQIERATQALDLLQQGVSILDTIDRLGYFDQPHLTKALKRFAGQTPAQILRLRESE
jgi:AraC-like DNA-binding protein